MKKNGRNWIASIFVMAFFEKWLIVYFIINNQQQCISASECRYINFLMRNHQQQYEYYFYLCTNYFLFNTTYCLFPLTFLLNNFISLSCEPWILCHLPFFQVSSCFMLFFWILGMLVTVYKCSFILLKILQNFRKTWLCLNAG